MRVLRSHCSKFILFFLLLTSAESACKIASHPRVPPHLFPSRPSDLRCSPITTQEQDVVNLEDEEMTEAEPNNGLIGKRLQIKEGRTKRICKARSPGHTRPAAASWPGVRRANRPIQRGCATRPLIRRIAFNLRLPARSVDAGGRLRHALQPPHDQVRGQWSPSDTEPQKLQLEHSQRARCSRRQPGAPRRTPRCRVVG